MLGFHDPPWMLPASQYPNTFQSSAPGTHKVAVRIVVLPDYFQYTIHRKANVTQSDVLTQTVQGETLKTEPGFPSASTSTITTDLVKNVQTYICKWQHSPGMPCLAVFDNAKSLHEHMKTAHVDNCTRCFCQWEGCEALSKDFKQRSKLSRHLLGHAGYRPYACSFEGCNKTFATNQAKDNHERTHTGERPYVCDRCGYTTTTHTQLQTHISALHEGKKPHKCRFCDFSCADSSNLSKHERTHQVSVCTDTRAHLSSCACVNNVSC